MSVSNYAVYLNANAKRVSPEVVTHIEELVHPSDLYVASTPEDSYTHARSILARNYPTVFTGGGDGTAVQLINALHQVARESDVEGRLPTLGVLSLGTGNALSSLVSSGSPIQDLKSYVTNPSHDVWPISLVEWEGHLFPFASMGIDAEVLADYVQMKSTFGSGRLKPLFQNVGGYFFAFFGGTVPRHIRWMIEGEKRTVRVTNLGERAYEAATRGGNMGRSFGAGEVVYDGPMSALVAGTIPVYGYNLRLLPFADRYPHFFHLRVAHMGALKGFVNLPSIWKGTYEGEGFADYYATHVKIEASDPVAFQTAGDLVGFRDQVEFKLLPSTVNLLRFI